MGKKEKTTSKKKKQSFKLSRKGLALWISLTFFACAWMFVLGILVGRETVPVKFNMEKLQNELAALKEAVIKKEMDHYKIDSKTDINKTKMEFYETLKKTGAEDRLKTSLSKPKRKPSDEKKSGLATKKTSPPKKVDIKQNQQTNRSKKVIAARKDKPVNLIKSKDVNKNFTVQIGSLKDANAADKWVAKLKKGGYPAYRSIGKIPGKGIWYRVRVGYFKNRNDAGNMLNRLKKEKINAIIVQR